MGDWLDIVFVSSHLWYFLKLIHLLVTLDLHRKYIDRCEPF
jgi:hypothetical protein